MLCQSVDEELCIETVVTNLLEDEQCAGHIARQECLVEAEVVVVIEHIEVLDGALVGDIPLARGRHLVEYRERVAHGAVGLLCYDIECGTLGLDAAVVGNILQLCHNVGHCDACEIVDLASRQNGGNDLLLLGSGENEDGILGRFLECLEKGVECLRREHVHLVDDEHAVTAHLWRDAHLVGDAADVVDRVVAGGVELHDVIAALLVESNARLALVARLAIGAHVLAVDGFGENAGTGGLAHASRTAEEVGVCQFAACNSGLERVGKRILANDRGKGRRPILARRNNIVLFHVCKVNKKRLIIIIICYILMQKKRTPRHLAFASC